MGCGASPVNRCGTSSDESRHIRYTPSCEGKAPCGRDDDNNMPDYINDIEEKREQRKRK